MFSKLFQQKTINFPSRCLQIELSGNVISNEKEIKEKTRFIYGSRLKYHDGTMS